MSSELGRPKCNTDRKYTGEFKQKVVEDLRQKSLGYREAAQNSEVAKKAEAEAAAKEKA